MLAKSALLPNIFGELNVIATVRSSVRLKAQGFGLGFPEPLLNMMRHSTQMSLRSCQKLGLPFFGENQQ